jgi:hypothetical protein
MTCSAACHQAGHATSTDADSCDRLAGQVIQAESYDALEAPMAIGARMDASGGQYLAGSADGAGSASFRFTASHDGHYLLWARVAADDDAASAVTATLDQGEPVTFAFPAGRTWHWARADANGMAVPIELTAGCHTLTLQSPKGASIDEWLVTDDADMQPAIRSVVDVGENWTGVEVGFTFLTHGDQQYVAFYDAHRQLTVGQRTVGQPQFRLKALPDVFGGWDGHNYVTFAFDSAGQIHLSGDMHVSPLAYFRTTVAGDITTLTHAAMVGTDESMVTYPAFMKLATGQLLFSYRSGGSGNGNWFWNIYDPQMQRWSRWLSTALFDGTSTSVSAYPVGPQLGPDGRYHLVWVWRDSPDGATNHDVSYARSTDLLHWETADGTPLVLPITPAQRSTIVDPVPVHGGLLNNDTRVGWDADGRLMISYIKFDAAGNTQAYTARREGTSWRVYQTSNWTWRWDFGGTGGVTVLVTVGGISLSGGELVQPFSHWKAGSGTWTLDPATLQPTGVFQQGTEIPPSLSVIETGMGNLPATIFADMKAYFLGGRGDGARAARYFLRWEALAPTNRDQARMCGTAVCAMPPGMMRLYELAD